LLDVQFLHRTEVEDIQELVFVVLTRAAGRLNT